VGKIPGRIRRSSSMALFVAAAFWCSAAHAQILIHFDLPAQSLARSLKAIGTATNTDVGFSAKQVAGFMAPRLKADLTLDGALIRVLAGTGLRSQHLDDHTIVIAATESSTPDPATVKLLPVNAFASVGQAADSSHTTNVVDASTDLRLFQADTTVSGESGNTEASRTDSPQLKELVVTGTHIRGVAPSSPVTTTTREDIDRSGHTSIGDVIRSLPQNFNGGNNPQTTVGSAPGADNGSVSGGSSPNLRGLGSGSTLTLVNGHRLADDTINGAVDVSLIPLAAIERVEVVTDGASAAYGSDAVAGVVNIILKKDYDGTQTSVLGGGTAQGGGTERQINQLLGKTWASGGILFDYEFDKQDPIYSTQRDYTSQAGSPTTPYPGSSRNSFFASGHQVFTPDFSGFIDALYTSRITRNSVTYGGGVFSNSSEIGVHQYSVVSGLDVALPGNWKLTPVVDLSGQRSNVISTITPPSAYPGPYPAFNYEGPTTSFEAGADGPLLKLPSGIVHAAFGAGYRRESYADNEQGVPSIVNAKRSVKYAYTEIAVPIVSPSDRGWIRRLDLNISGREEHYSDFGSEAVPKLGLVYSPADPVKLRATWGKAFRAPPLFSMFEEQTLLLLPITDPTSRTGISTVLIPGGGNAKLSPETAKTWTIGFDYDSDFLKGLHVAGTYYDIAYINRISQIPTFFSALTDPLSAPFVTRSPSLAYQQTLIAAAGPNFTNGTGVPYDPESVAAVVNDKMVNIARQDVTGVDLSADYKRPTSGGVLDVFANASFLDLRQKTVPTAPETEISGQAFEPAKFRARAGASWRIGAWAATGIVNFTGSEVNTYQPDLPHVSSWTTVDVQLSYRPELPGPLAGIQAALSVQNAFDRDPPFVLFDQYVPGLHYDPLNGNVLGRFITLRLSKAFQ
jgi:iron complex outermembrane receptor protein